VWPFGSVIVFGFTFVVGSASALTIPVGFSETLEIPGLVRVAVGNRKIVNVRAIPPKTILVSALRKGRTLVRVWSHHGEQPPVIVKVVEDGAYQESAGLSTSPVIHVALEFLELAQSNGRRLGVHWPEAIHFDGSGTVHGSQSTSGVNYVAAFSTAKGWMDHVVHEGWAKLIANPDLYVRLGEESVFHAGGEFPVAQALENYGGVGRRVDWKPYGFTVKVRPQSVDLYHISSDLDIEVSEPNVAQGIDGVPAINRRKIQTKMNSVDGQTVILSGLVRRAKSHGERGLPGLSSVPLLGYLFSSKSDEEEVSELLMAATFRLKTVLSEEKVISERRRALENE